MSVQSVSFVAGYKGFDKNFRCRGMQYEVGQTYEVPEASLGRAGLHFCESPLDVFNYYPPDDSRFAEVVAENPTAEKGEDSIRVTKKLTVKAELTLKEVIEAAIKFIWDRVEAIPEKCDRLEATWCNTGNIDTDTGDFSVAVNLGDCGAATNTGHQSTALNGEEYGTATNTGYQGAAITTADDCTAASSGELSVAASLGDSSTAAGTGIHSSAINVGGYGTALNTGDYSTATATGYRGVALNTGELGIASVFERESVSIALGRNGKAKAGLGSWIVLAEWECHRLIAVKSAQVDGEIIKADTFYILENGEFTEIEDSFNDDTL